MSLYFLLNNLHFALEILGALAFLIVAWLALDSLRIRSDLLTASRAAGFLLLAVWQILHAFGLSSILGNYAAFAVYILGLVFVLLNLILERPVVRPKFEAILLLPAAAALAPYVNALASIFLILITFLAYQQYKHELKKSIKPFWIGFVLLSLGGLASIFENPDSLGAVWMLGHIFEFLGFASLIYWAWQYLQLRIREELVLILVSGALAVSIIVTLAFSIILVNQIESATKANLLSNAKVLDLYVGRLKEEALAKSELLAGTAGFENLLAKNDFLKLETAASSYLESEHLGFLSIVNKNGEVVLRAHALTQRGDDLSNDAAVAAALVGKDLVTIESSQAEKFSVRAASPLRLRGKIVGAAVTGFLLDNALADDIKRVTGLEVSILDGDTVVATTLLNPDGRSRSTGIKIIDSEVKSAVLAGGQEIVLRTEISSRQVLASYTPVKNSEGKIIGMLSSVKPQQEILNLANATNRLTLVTVAVLMLILAFPIYLATKRLSGEIS